MSKLLTPDLPLCPEAVDHRLLSRELRQQSRFLFLQQLELQAEASVPLYFCFQRMETVLGNKQTPLIINSHQVMKCQEYHLVSYLEDVSSLL